MKTTLRLSLWGTGVLALLGILATGASAKEVGPVYRAAQDVNLTQGVDVDKLADVKGYGGDGTHPWHHLPADVLVLAYRSTSMFQAEILRYYYRWTTSNGVACGGPMFPSGAAQLTGSDSPFVKDANGDITGYKPGYIASMNEGSTDTIYDPGTPDMIISWANHMDTAPNKDVCLNWYQGPWEECTRPADWSAQKVKAWFTNAIAAAMSRVGSDMDPFTWAKVGSNTIENPYSEQRVGPAFDVDVDQPQSCCRSWHVLEACIGSDSLGAGSFGEHGNGIGPDLAWKAVTGHGAVPTCSGTGWSGGIEFKTFYIHTVGDAPTGGVMQAAIAVVSATMSAGGVPGADKVNRVMEALQKAIEATQGSDASTSVAILETTFDAEFLGPPHVTWNATEHSDLPGCRSILVDD